MPSLGSSENVKGPPKESGALFAEAQMPSAGNLTVEADREVIKKIENKVMQTYVHFAILCQCTLMELLEHDSSHAFETLHFTLHGKQFGRNSEDIVMMASHLEQKTFSTKLVTLDLSRNLLSPRTTKALMTEVVLKLPALEKLDLSENPLMGPKAMEILCKYLKSTKLVTLRLRGEGDINVFCLCTHSHNGSPIIQPSVH